MRRQKNLRQDNQDTERFHRWLSALKPPRQTIDGVKWNPFTHPLNWPGWPMVRLPVRWLK